MADVMTKAQRSYNMSMIHGSDTKPEEIVRKYLFKKGYRYRKNDPRLPGKPDVVLLKYKTVFAKEQPRLSVAVLLFLHNRLAVWKTVNLLCST